MVPMNAPKLCKNCQTIHEGVPDVHTFYAPTETYYWQCVGIKANGETCHSTLMYMPDPERSMELIRLEYEREKGIK